MTDAIQLTLLLTFIVIVLGSILGAAPTPTVRGTPAGIPLYEGFSIKVTLSLNTTISFWEKGVKGSGVDHGDLINITTQFNSGRETFYPRQLAKNDDVTITASWDPNVYNQIEAMRGNPSNVVTETYPDGSTYCYWGVVKKIERSEMKANAGEQPEITVTIGVTNYDPTNKVEALPVLTSVAGT